MKTTKKELSKEQQEEIKKSIELKGYLEVEDIEYFRKKYNFSPATIKRELINNCIPYINKNPAITLIGFGINVIDKKINLNDFLLLGNWKEELFKGSKIRALFSCKECGDSSNSMLRNLIQRNFFKLEPICAKCIGKKVTNTEEWKSTNSDAQLIAQNKPGQLEKNRQAQIKRFKDPEVLRKHSEAGKKNWENPDYREKMNKIAIDKWKNPEYAKKVIENSRASQKCGVYNGVFYNSSYELAYLLKIENENGDLQKIKRPDFYISYIKKNGNSSCYYPDFVLDNIFLIEVKGYAPWIDLENLARKNKAAKKWCNLHNLKFRVVELKDFGNFWLKKALKKHKEILDDKAKM